MKDYFNKFEFDKANDIKWINPELSLQLFNEYFKKYPYDYSSYPFYIDVLINFGYINKAIDLKNKVNKMVSLDQKYLDNKDKLLHFKYGMIYCEMRLLSLLGEYEKLMNYAYENESILSSFNDNYNNGGVIFYCKKKLGLLDPSRRDNNKYLFRQILEYREDDFKDHIKKHLSTNDEENSCVFSDDFPFEKIFLEIKKIIPCNKKIRTSVFDDKYIFKFDNCGRANHKLTDFFEVITLQDSSDFITMYPTNISSNILHFDLNYLREIESIKEEKISQIDKFYKRYQKK